MYRGYYYDSETGLYYLQSRYYDPQVGRFINADDTDVLDVQDDLYDKNLFAYCDNNPVIRADDGGDFWHIVAGAVVGGLIGGAASVITQAITNKGKIDFAQTLIAVGSGVLTGALASTGVGLVGQAVGGAAISMATNATSQVVDNGWFNNFSVKNMVIDGAIGAISGKIGGAGKGNYSLKNASKLMNKNAVSAVKNNTKNGVKGAVKRYKSCRAVNRYFKELKSFKSLGTNLGVGTAGNLISKGVSELLKMYGGV